MNENEPRYTKKEWIQKRIDDRVVSGMRHVFTGYRIESIEVLNKIMSEIQIVTKPDMFKSYILGICIAIHAKDDEKIERG